MQKNIQFTPVGFLVWIICAIYFLYELFLRTVIGTFQHPIMYDLHLSTVKFSLLSSTTYLLIYAAMQIPVGIIVDNFGLKKSVLFGVSVCALSSFGFSLANDYTSAIFFRMLTGFGSSFGFICLLVAVYDWMPHRYIGLFLGLSQFIGVMGPMIAAGPLTEITEVGGISWREVFVWLSIFGGILVLLVLLFVRNNPEKSGAYIILHRAQPMSARVFNNFMRWQPWLIGIFSATVYFAIEYLSENEGKSFLILKGFSTQFSSYMITLSWFAFALSSPLLGFISDHILRRRLVMLWSAIGYLIGLTLIAFAATKITIIAAFMLLGFGASAQSLAFANMAEQFKPQYLPLALALNNALVTVTIAINAPILGLVVEHLGYDASFVAIIGIALVALAIITFGIKETFCKSQADFTYLRQQTKPVAAH